MNKGNVVVIGSGFAGFSAAISLADKGYKVKILEKNPSIGGRARQFTESGFTFDMGPSWYWVCPMCSNHSSINSVKVLLITMN